STLCVMFLQLRQVPRSTLFPYTTLFRSAVDGCYTPILRSSRHGEAESRRKNLPHAQPAQGDPRQIPARRDVRRGMAYGRRAQRGDRKSTRLNSSHLVISYAVFCLKKKNN